MFGGLVLDCRRMIFGVEKPCSNFLNIYIVQQLFFFVCCQGTFVVEIQH